MTTPHLFRCHNLAELMTDPKNKSDVLSQGAKAALRKIAKQILFDVQITVDTKYMRKGIEMEGSSIALLNAVYGTSYAKNTERKSNGFISGEPDIVAADHGRDIKTSWSIETFPLTEEEAADKTYEWQARAYMWLFDRPRWSIDYCLVDTPDHLIGWEDFRMHKVTDIPPYQRVTTIWYERDAELEAKMAARVKEAQAYLDILLSSLRRHYDILADINPKESGVTTPISAPPARRTQTAKEAFAN